MAWKGSGVQFPLAPRFTPLEVERLFCSSLAGWLAVWRIRMLILRFRLRGDRLALQLSYFG